MSKQVVPTLFLGSLVMITRYHHTQLELRASHFLYGQKEEESFPEVPGEAQMG